jgi:hypothetical protein
LHVATAAEDLHTDLVDELHRALPGSFFTAAVPADTFEKRNCPGLNSFRMITLWPFQLDEDAAQSTLQQTAERRGHENHNDAR